MVTVIVRHKVKNYAKWRTAFDDFKKVRRAAGEKSFKLGNIVGKKNTVVGTMRFDSAENAKAFFRSKDLKAKMAEAGVLEKPDIWIVEDR